MNLAALDGGCVAGSDVAVAVGGAIAKTIDGFAQGSMAENPGVKITPIYAGTYQETIVKALTAHKSGTPPVTSVVLSTDMFTLIDEGVIVPFDDFAKTLEDKAWLKNFFPAFMLNSRTDGKTWGIPFQRSTVVTYWNKEAFKEAGLNPDKAPATWAELKEAATKAHEEGRQGQCLPLGRADPVERLSVLVVPDGVDHQRRDLDQRETGTKVKFDDPQVIEALQYWVDLDKSGVHPPGVVE